MYHPGFAMMDGRCTDSYKKHLHYYKKYSRNYYKVDEGLDKKTDPYKASDLGSLSSQNLGGFVLLIYTCLCELAIK